jgi:uncharacterized phage protein gp47/JayE
MSTLDANGLTIDTLNEIITSLEDGYKVIYGNDITVDSNTPDGQLINLYAQSMRDLLEVVQQVYIGFDVEQAIGIVLDQRVSLLGIQRQGATFTQQQVEITTDRSLTLEGLDADATDPDGTGYTVADDTGTQFILLDTFNAPSAGTYNLTFRAQELGSITTTPNTVTNPVTVVLGVTNIDNPTGALEIGLDGELDAALRLRSTKSTANKSEGFIDGLTGLLLNIDGVTDARVYENDTASTDGDGIPPHSIWTIVEGGANTDIANTIYSTKNAGCGMKGTVTVEITTINGSIFTARFDRPASKSLWIRFDIQATRAAQTFDEDGIKQYITDNLAFSIGDPANTATVTCIAQDAINATSGGGVPLNVEISDDDVTYVDYLETDTLDEKWIIDNARITITVL